jgi:hypothetical protein
MLSFRFNTVPLHDVVVFMSSFEGRLHLCKLVLNAVQLDTCVFASLSDFADLLFFFTKTEINSLMLVRQLFGQSILESNHQNL